MTVEEYRERLKDGEAKEQHFIAVRNAWRKIVVRRALQLKHARERRAKLAKPHVVGGNRVEGGKAEERLLFAMEYAAKTFRLYYSESGAWVKGFALTNVPAGEFRSDCSWWYTMIRYACGLQGPSLTGGYTGTILTEGKAVSRHYAETHTGVAVVFGSGTGIHVGMSTGHGPTIYQHGQEPVETGTFDEFGPGVEVRYRAFPNKPLKGA